MYVAVKGGEKAIAAAHQLLACERRGNPQVNELGCEQIEQQLGLAVDRVMRSKPFFCCALIAPPCRVWRPASRSTPLRCA
jgi:alpha-D-ribose 1-methylphosphonate 5-triphosphate synthase subunit PhnI